MEQIEMKKTWSTRYAVRALAAGALIATWTLGCGSSGDETDTTEAVDRATELAQQLLIVDTHVDLPYRLYEEMEDITVRTEGGDFDLPRARAGGLNAPFMSIYVPAETQETEGASKERADELIDLVEGLVAQSPDDMTIVSSPTEVDAAFAAGKIALPLGMENGAPLATLDDLQHFFDRGIRYVTLTHSENNQICDSSYARERTWDGLSDYGREVVGEMNRLGVIIDISHVSDDTFWQVIELTEAPVIASHSSCRFFTPGFERNIDDNMIGAMAKNGGVVQINFGSSFLTEESNQRSISRWMEHGEWLETTGTDPDSPEAEAHMDQIERESPTILADVTDVADHIDHVVGLVGIDHVGIGSDFDGVGPTTPTGLKDVSQFPNLIRELLTRGYSEPDIEKILAGNIMRVWRRVEAVAREQQGAAGEEAIAAR